MLCYDNWGTNLASPYGLWTITPSNAEGTDGGFVQYIYPDSENGIGILNPGIQDWFISPSLYLSSDTTLSGSGTRENPYTITN